MTTATNLKTQLGNNQTSNSIDMDLATQNGNNQIGNNRVSLHGRHQTVMDKEMTIMATKRVMTNQKTQHGNNHIGNNLDTNLGIRCGNSRIIQPGNNQMSMGREFLFCNNLTTTSNRHGPTFQPVSNIYKLNFQNAFIW